MLSCDRTQTKVIARGGALETMVASPGGIWKIEGVLVNQRIASWIFQAVDFFFLADIQKMLKLEPLQLFSYRHQHKKIQ
jgi:hypothetical protein